MKYFQITLALVTYILLSHYVYGLQITEIMFNPDGADNGREWIEISLNESDGCINFTEYKLFEEETNHNIYKYNYGSDIACQYIILSNDINKFLQDYNYANNTNFSNNIALYKSTFSLSNDGENIAIKKDNNILDEVNYTLLIENLDVSEGHSLEYYSNFWRNSELLKGNPGNVLYNSSDYENITNSNSTINENMTNTTTNLTTTNFTTINSTENITENVTENIAENNTSNSTVNSAVNSTDNLSYIQKCNVSINIILKNASIIFENNIPIKFQNKIETDNSSQTESGYIIEYWIEDLFGNVVKNKVATNNQDEKSFTPKIEEADKILVIKNTLKNYSVNNDSCSINKNSSEKIFLVKNSLYTFAKPPICPACNSKASSCESNSYPIICPNVASNESQKSLIKIINVCNESKTVSSSDMKSMQNNLAPNSYGLSGSNQVQTSNISSENLSSKNSTQNAGKTTSMIVYESPNMKNRFYALIGLILVGITCISILIYKITMHKSVNTVKE